MNKKMVAGLVLVTAVFAAVLGSGLASADQQTGEKSPATNTVVDDVQPENGPGAGGLPFG